MSYLITDVTRRDQAPLGRFQPRSNMKTHGVIWAAVEGGSDERFPHVNDVQTNGVQVGETGTRLRYDEFKDEKGKPNDIVLASGLRLREMNCPIEYVHQKEKMEAEVSTQRVKSYDRSVAAKQRPDDGGNVRLTSETTHSQMRPAAPEPVPRADSPRTKSPRTPEQIEAAKNRMAAVRATRKPKVTA